MIRKTHAITASSFVLPRMLRFIPRLLLPLLVPLLVVVSQSASAAGQKSPRMPVGSSARYPATTKSAVGVTPVLLELFTSQGCSSCPDADAMLRRLMRDPAIAPLVAPLSLHVDYWDGLGWKDPYSDARWSSRQRKYATRNKNSKVKTPMAIIDGHYEVPAHRFDLLRSAIRNISRAPHAGRIEISVQESTMTARVKINAYLKKTVQGRHVDVVVALYEDNLRTAVQRGENAGQDLRNDRVIRHWDVVDRISVLGGSICHKSVFLPLPPNWKGRKYGAVAFLQTQPGLKVLGTSRVHFGHAGDIPSGNRKSPKHRRR